MSIKTEPAFPTTYGPAERITCEGLTKRELIAAMVMQGLSRNLMISEPVWLDSYDDGPRAARSAVYYADLLLAELQKNPEDK